MFLYLSCATPCAVKVDGNYIGRASKNPSYIDIERGFIELIPESGEFNPFCLFFDEKRLDLVKNAKLIDLYGGFLLIPEFKRTISAEFKVIKTDSLELGEGYRCSVYYSGGARLMITSKGDFFTACLPFCPDEVTFTACAHKGEGYIACILTSSRTLIKVFKLSPKIEEVFSSLVDGYRFDKNLLYTVENKGDILRHTVSSTWAFEDKVRLKSYLVSPKKQPFALPERLFGFAFFEEILLGGDISPYLTPRLKPRADELRSFLGDFRQIMQPPHFKDSDLITLVYDNKVEYARLELFSGLINNVLLI